MTDQMPPEMDEIIKIQNNNKTDMPKDIGLMLAVHIQLSVHIVKQFPVFILIE